MSRGVGRRGLILGVAGGLAGYAVSASATDMVVHGGGVASGGSPLPEGLALPDPLAGGLQARPTVPAQAMEALPPWRRFAVAPAPADGRPVIAIVIDDVGELRGPSERAVALPGAVTLAWFPFSRDLANQVAASSARGHETLLHMPMQASYTNSIAQTGPDPLRVDIPRDVNLSRLRTAMQAVPQAVGLNNHMGTLVTRNEPLMEMVAGETRSRGMLFLDSMVVAHSYGLPTALQAGVPAAANDIFLDPIMGSASVLQQLDRVEHAARHRGYAIAIGHPHPRTLEGLEAWLPTVAAKGLVLWPISAAVAFRNHLDLPGVPV